MVAESLHQLDLLLLLDLGLEEVAVVLENPARLDTLLLCSTMIVPE